MDSVGGDVESGECHGNFGPGDQNFRNIGPGGPFFPENFGPPVKISVRPA